MQYPGITQAKTDAIDLRWIWHGAAFGVVLALAVIAWVLAR
jgi:hypothetical protein